MEKINPSDIVLEPFDKYQKKVEWKMTRASQGNSKYIIRMLPKGENLKISKELIKKEHNYLLKYNLPEFLKFKKIITSDKSFFVLYEDCNKGSISGQVLKKEEDIKDLAQQIVKAICVLLEDGIVVKDLKADYIYSHEEKGKITFKIDLMSALKLNEELEKQESVKVSVPQLLKDTQVVYNFGQLLSQIVSEAKIAPSEDLKHLIKRCTDSVEKNRILIHDILGHPFLHHQGRFQERYEFISKLGSGGFGDVFLVKEINTKEEYAVKKIDVEPYDLTLEAFNTHLSNQGITKIFREIITMYKLAYIDNFTKIYDHFFDNNSLYIVMEYCSGGNLKVLYDKYVDVGFPRDLLFDVAMQLADGLNKMHKFGIVHRDLKPANVVLKSGDPKNVKLKICDFGLAKRIMENAPEYMSINIQNKFYIPPEAHDFEMPLSTSYDIWVYGIMLFEMVYGYYPAKKDNEYTQLRSNGKLSFPETRKGIGEDINILINKCIKPEPNKRLNAQAIMQELGRINSKS